MLKGMNANTVVFHGSDYREKDREAQDHNWLWSNPFNHLLVKSDGIFGDLDEWDFFIYAKQ